MRQGAGHPLTVEHDEGIMLGSYFVLLSIIVGLVAGVTAFYFLYDNAVNGETSVPIYIQQSGPDTYHIVTNQSSGTLHTQLHLGLDPGTCYRLIVNFNIRPVNLTLQATPTLVNYCQG